MELKDYKKPDLNAPRYFEEKLSVTERGFYPEMVAQYPNLAKYSPKEIVKMLKGFNREKVAIPVMSTREGVKLPNALGTIFLGFFKNKYHLDLTTDATASEELGKKVHHSNYSSDGFIPYIYYSKYYGSYRNPFLNSEYWSFEPCRNITRSMKQYIDKDWKKYVIIDSKSTIKRMVDALYYKRDKQYRERKQLANYDPFKIEED